MKNKKALEELLKSLTPAQRELLAKGEGEDDDEDDEEEDGGGEEEEDEDEMDKSFDPGSLQKSLDLLERLQGRAPLAPSQIGGEDVALAKSMDATGFVRSLVDGVDASNAVVAERVNELAEYQGVSNTAILATGRMTMGLQKSIDALYERVDTLLATLGGAARPRSLTPGIVPVAKSFGTTGSKPGAQLTKGQATTALSRLEKSYRDAGDVDRAYEVQKHLITLESAGTLDPRGRELLSEAVKKAS